MEDQHKEALEVLERAIAAGEHLVYSLPSAGEGGRAVPPIPVDRTSVRDDLANAYVNVGR